MKPIIQYDDFAKLDLRVGEVIECAPKEGSEKLLRLTVDFGEEGKRNILSGIAQWYKPEDLIGKQFVFVFNLAPRRMMGEDSEGMILAAESDSVGSEGEQTTSGNDPKPFLLTPDAKTTPGSPIH